MPGIGTRAILRANLRMLQSVGAIEGDLIEAVTRAFAPSSRLAETDDRGQGLDAALASATGPGLSPRGPIVIAGLAQGVLQRVDEVLCRAERGQLFLQRVLVVEPNLEYVARCLASEDLTGRIIHPERFVMLVGEAWIARLDRWLEQRIDSGLPALVLQAGGGADQDMLDLLRETLEAAAARQVREQKRLVAATDAGLDEAAGDPVNARGILREGASGSRSLRVLLCGSLYTSYVRHSLEGLAEGLRSLGHTAETLFEADRSSTLTTLSYRRAVLSMSPDLIITANYPRLLLGSALPGHIPHVCWIQDSMPHLMDERIGQSVGETELFIGNTLPELAETFGYPRHTLVPSCVPASEHRFHPVEIGRSSRHRWACDVAFVSHHSETPESMRDRLIREMGGELQGRAIVMALWDAMPALSSEAARSPLGASVDRTIREQIGRAIGQEPSAAQCSMIRHRVALPLFGRMFRHESLRWAKAICDRRGWSLKLFGRGWERTPRLATHAAGEVEHGEPLRACYQAARAHLHLDPNTLSHQRVFECAMSGGLPIARFHHDALNPLLICAADEASEAGADTWTAVPLGRRYLAACDEVGTEPMGCAEAVACVPGMTKSVREQMLRVFDPHWLLVGLGDVTFHDEASMERVLERAIDDEAWRDERSAAMRGRMIESVGMRAFAQRMLDAAWPIIGWKSDCIRKGYGWPPRPDWAEQPMNEGGANAA